MRCERRFLEMRTKRQLNPLDPDYELPGEKQLAGKTIVPQQYGNLTLEAHAAGPDYSKIANMRTVDMKRNSSTSHLDALKYARTFAPHLSLLSIALCCFSMKESRNGEQSEPSDVA